MQFVAHDRKSIQKLNENKVKEMMSDEWGWNFGGFRAHLVFFLKKFPN